MVGLAVDGIKTITTEHTFVKSINCFKSQCRNIIPIAKAVAGEAASPNTCVNDTHLGGLQLVPHEAPRGGNCYGQ